MFDVVRATEETINLLREGEISCKQANTMFIGCNIVLKTYALLMGKR